MKIQKQGKSFKVWLSAHETKQWAKCWPCSIVQGKRLYAEFYNGDLVDIALNGSIKEIPSHEFNAIIENYCGTYRPGEE